MSPSPRYRINTPRVVHENFEHEVVIVNLDTGRYYCLQRTGVALWHGLAAGETPADIVAAFEREYDATSEVITDAVQSAIATLVAEELIVADAPRDPSAPAAAPRPAAVEPGPRRRFEAPTLETYTDMQDLLLLDPIHEVDEAGWPYAAEAPRKDASSDSQ